jgi:hypothetical protein
MAVRISGAYRIEAQSSNDIVIQIKDAYFPAKRLAYSKTVEVKEEWGTGSHLMYDLSTHNIGFAGSFDVGTWLHEKDKHALTYMLENQSDEGVPEWFAILIMNRLAEYDPHPPGFYEGQSEDAGEGDPARTVTTQEVNSATFEKLINCKITRAGRDYPLNDTIMTQYEFKAMRRTPM